MPQALQMSSVARGPFALDLLERALATGIRFNGAWEDLSLFVKGVNDGWSRDTARAEDWFPPRIFHGVPRLHLPRTLTILAVTTYLIHASKVEEEALVPGAMPVQRSWMGGIPWPDPSDPSMLQAPAIQLWEILYHYSPPPIPQGVQAAIIDAYGLGAFHPEAGLGNLYGFALAEGCFQGFSLPFLEREGHLLPACMPGTPPSTLASRFLLEPWDQARTRRHQERFYEVFDLPKALAGAWHRQAGLCLQLLMSPEAVLGLN
jgi:hypothetical protein